MYIHIKRGFAAKLYDEPSKVTAIRHLRNAKGPITLGLLESKHVVEIIKAMDRPELDPGPFRDDSILITLQP